MINDNSYKILPPWLKEIIDRGKRYTYYGRVSSKNIFSLLYNGELYKINVKEIIKSRFDIFNSSVHSKKIKVAFFCDGIVLPIETGAAYSIFNELCFLHKNGVETILILCDRGWHNVNLYFSYGFPVFFLNEEDYYLLTDTIERILNLLNLDFVQFFSPSDVICYDKTLKKLSIPICYEMQNVNSVLFRRLRAPANEIALAHEEQKSACERANLVMCRSSIDYAYIINDCVVDKNKVIIFNGGIDPFKIEYQAPNLKHKKILLLGNYYYKPNENSIRYLFNEIFKATIRILPDIKFFIVGDTPNDLIQEFSNDSFIFCGFVENLNNIFRNVDIAVCPIREGSGTRLKILDYLAAGLPTISTSIGIEGLDSRVRDVIFIEDCLSKYPQLIKNLYFLRQDQLELLTLRGRKFVEDHYSWDHIVPQIISVYSMYKK